MKTNTIIFWVAFLIIGSVWGIIAMPEGRVVEYRPDTSGASGGYGSMRIQIVIENGLDNYIPCDALSLKEVVALCDSLNKQLTYAK
jgi:hypothetical protein